MANTVVTSNLETSNSSSYDTPPEIITLEDSASNGPSDDELQHLAKKLKTSQGEEESAETSSPSLISRSDNNDQKQLTFEFGPYVPIIKQNDGLLIDPNGIVDCYKPLNSSQAGRRLLGEILHDDIILDAPSLVTPLLLKKRTIWPPKVKDEQVQSKDDDGRSPKETSSSHELVTERSKYKPEEYIKSTVVASLTNNSRINASNNKTILSIQDFFGSSAGELLLGIGLSRVTEHNLEEHIRRLSGRIKKGFNEFIPELETSRSKLHEAKKFNSPYKSPDDFTCPHCDFHTNSNIVLEGHLEEPHINSKREYTCNWCQFRTRDSGQMIYHNLVEHQKRCRIEKPPALHCCRNCSFEFKSRRKLNTHLNKCEHTFQKHLVQACTVYEYPTITSKFITQEDVKLYESTLKALRLAAYNPHQIKVSRSTNQGSTGQQILVLPRSSVPLTTIGLSKTTNTQSTISLTATSRPYGVPVAFLTPAGLKVNPTSIQQMARNSPQLLHILAPNGKPQDLQQKATILRYPKATSQFVNGMAVVNSAQNVIMAPETPANAKKVPVITVGDSPKTDFNVQTPSGQSNSNETFLICEICDGYIESRAQYKSHMQWVHNVKIHQKTLESSRPPLNCQKCQWRFYTDQGLERHLLGSHGLVTPNMKEQADNESDSGRCTVCGCKFARNLVNHMKDFHKMTLRPAQLSYRCTVCSATFNLYRLFENHVYRLHSESIRRVPSN